MTAADHPTEVATGAPPTRPVLSVIIPALNEAPGIPGLLARYRELAATHSDMEFELVLIDDGSTDGTSEAMAAQAMANDAVTIVTLARNFGSHYAISAGLRVCRGDAAVVLGADLPEPPSLLADFLQHWRTGSDVVWGVRQTRVKRSIAYDLMSRSFSILFSRFGRLSNYPPEGPSGVLLDRCVIDEVIRLPEHNRNVLALIAWLGFTQTRVEYVQTERVHGESRWTRRSIIKLAADSMLQFSSLPLRSCIGAGLVAASLGILYAAFLVVRAIVGVTTPSGWPTVLCVILVLGGVQLTLMGMVGEYLWRALEETRGRPLYVVRDVRRVGQNGIRSEFAPRHGRRPTAEGT